MIMCLSTKGYCFQEQWAIVLPVVFVLFCNLKILKQGIELQIFPNALWRFLKKGEPPRQVAFKCPPGTKHPVDQTYVFLLADLLLARDSLAKLGYLIRNSSYLWC